MTAPFAIAQESEARLRLRARQRVASTPTTSPVQWKPNAGPQTLAYESQADILGYGGSAGSGKSDLLLGLAGTQHRRAIIFRRVFPSVRGMIDRSREIFNAGGDSHSRDSYNESLHIWRLRDGRMIEFGSLQYEGDGKKHQGQPRDFFGFDELTEFSETQFRFVTAWNRSTYVDPVTGLPQRCRVVCTFNPPMDDAGGWVVSFFGPWLDPDHPNPAKDGELRWYAMVDGVETAVACGEPFEHKGAMVYPRSRTFIRGTLADTPQLRDTGYAAVIDALPEPLRSKLKGNFQAGKVANPFQVIPSDWLRLAQERWNQCERPATQTATGCDPARGGEDKTVIARWYDNFLDALEKHPGIATPDGPAVAALLASDVVAEVPIGIDIIGIGSSGYDTLKYQDANVIAVNFGEGTTERDRSGKFKLRNVRAAAYWALREALDPVHGDDLALPPDPELFADLIAPRWKVTVAGILIEDKEEIKARLGRSPDCADAVVIGHYVARAADVCIAVL